MINLVVGINEGFWEWEYVTKFLFPGANIIRLDDSTKVVDNPVIVYSCLNGQIDEKTFAYINKYSDKSFSLVHLSNEWNYGLKMYQNQIGNSYPIYTRAKHVFRQYWSPFANYDNVTTIPVGWKSGFFSADKSKIEDFHIPIDCCFFGEVKVDRQPMIDVMTNSFRGKCFIWKTKRFGCETSASIEKQISVYKTSTIVPCPSGNCHPDTFRVCEVLESGGIPVIKNYLGFEYHTKVFGEETPIPKINNWNELPGLVEKIHNFGVKKFANEIQQWYNIYKRSLLLRIRGAIGIDY